MWVKICANTNATDAKLAAELGADAVGFVFAPSKRQVTIPQVAAITRELPDSMEKVGVFSSTDVDEVIAAVREAGLTAAQLHQPVDETFVEAIIEAFEGHVKVIQTVRCDVNGPNEAFERELTSVLLRAGVWAVLLDTAKAGASGGLGVAFDWESVAPFVVRAYEQARKARVEDVPKLIVAGGLNAENVGRAIEVLQPFGVDVASGTEESPGKKSAERMRAFVHAAKSAR